MTPELHWCLTCSKLFLCWEDCGDRHRLARLKQQYWEGLAPCPDCGVRPEPVKVL